jgi:uncharacterized protein (TIGR00159 family)
MGSASPSPLEPAIHFFEQLRANIRWADVLDVAVIACFVYFALLWLRARTSRAAALAFLALLFLYILSRRLDMYLTYLLLQAGITALLVILILVFQDDVRRMIDRIAAWGSPRKRQYRPPAVRGLDEAAEAIATLARRKIGALLVFVGRESIDRHAHGGVEVDGRLSVPLLLSIFDPHSPGHDGAVVLSGDRILKLGVHLPLSGNLDAVEGRGTRHAAGLGLAEVSDALVVIVSEERGTIGIAQSGELTQLESPAELKGWLEAFYGRLFPEPEARRRSWLRRHTGLKAVSIGLACLLWLVFAYRVETIQRTYTVPIVYRNSSPEHQPADPRPTSAEVTLVGSERIFDLFDPSTMVISLDLEHAESGELPITARDLNRPSGLEVTHIVPETIRLVGSSSPGG